ncbi:MAG: CsgG/HfaB family protein [Candidatus Electryonea clarkiae]|nr:CsgG/HfaB family protein [Candidatus Electryonea clarkiae]MDP8286463.1 CsgG/HfaB family protein [Candidatus Electryonea clarkiae]
MKKIFINQGFCFFVISIFYLLFAPYRVVAQNDSKTTEKFQAAIMDLEIGGGIPGVYQKTLSDRLRLELLNTGRFLVIERNAMEDILVEQGFQLSGCTSDECAVQMGRLLGVDRIVAGSVGRVGETHSVILMTSNYTIPVNRSFDRTGE